MTKLETVDWSKIPAPTDDGAAGHLPGRDLPPIALPATDGSRIDLSSERGTTVVYVYPMTGRPDVPLPEGWDLIPGARGCTPEVCAFRDHFAELRSAGADNVYGLSMQDRDYQREAVKRLHLPFQLLSDHQGRFARALGLPTFEAGGMKFLKRLTLVSVDGCILHVFYPVFPPDRHADEVIDWLKSRSM